MPRLAGENVLAVEAEFAYASAGEGLHYVTDPADGSTCVSSKAYRGGARRIYCCFDQPDLRAAFTVSVKAPAGWSCLGNAPVLSRPPDSTAGTWRFAPTAPLARGVTSFCAGPFAGASFACERDRGSALPVTVQALPSAAGLLQPERTAEMPGEPVRYYERNLGVPYPYQKCDLLYVPGFPGLAFSAPGLIAIRDRALKDDQPGSPALYLPTVIAHELAHAWIGGLVNICRGEQIEMWLVEALATYLSRTALAEIQPGTTPWAASTAVTLPDHAYAKDAAAIRQLEMLIGQQAVISGLSSLLRSHAHGNAARADLVRCWSQASGRDLREWAAETLIPAGSAKSETT